MEAIIRSINHIARLATLYREKELKKFGLGGMHHTYILNICRQPGISQEALAKKIFVNKSNVARQLAILEERGFVTRTSSPPTNDNYWFIQPKKHSPSNQQSNSCFKAGMNKS